MRADQAAEKVAGIYAAATSKELAADYTAGRSTVAAIGNECCGRMLGVGADQYDMGAEQKFERMAPSEILEGAREELLDLINYAAMTIIRLEQVNERIAAIEGGAVCKWPVCDCTITCRDRRAGKYRLKPGDYR